MIPLLEPKKLSLKWLMIGAVWLGSAQTNLAYAAAIENSDIAPAAAAVGNAVVSGMGNLSDSFYNPAALAWQDGVQAMFVNQSRFRNAGVNIAGYGHDGHASLGTRSAFAMSWMPEGGTLGVAASLSNPYDSRLDWGYIFPTSGFMSLEMARYSLDGLWRVNNTLGIDLGLDVYDSSMRLNTNGQSFSGSGWSDVGGHIGVRWEFMPFWNFGAFYRQGVTSKMSNNSGASSSINLPDELSIGVSRALMDDEILLAMDIKQSKWSAFDSLNVSTGGINSQTNAMNLRDTTNLMLGLTWFWRTDTQLRFGYVYEQNASQSAAYQPLAFDLPGHKFTAGFGGMMATMHLDVSWTGTIYPSKDISGIYAGKYSDAKYSLMFSLSKKF